MSSQLHGVDRKGRATLARRVRREQLLKLLSELEPSLIGIEAYTGAFYRQRQFEKLGHAVKIMAPQCVMAPDCPIVGIVTGRITTGLTVLLLTTIWARVLPFFLAHYWSIDWGLLLGFLATGLIEQFRKAMKHPGTFGTAQGCSLL